MNGVSKQRKVYIRQNPDGMTCEELAALFGISTEKVMDIQRDEHVDVDISKHPAEVKFVMDNDGIMTNTQIVAALQRITGETFNQRWVERVRKKCAILQKRNESESEESAANRRAGQAGAGQRRTKPKSGANSIPRESQPEPRQGQD